MQEVSIKAYSVKAYKNNKWNFKGRLNFNFLMMTNWSGKLTN